MRKRELLLPFFVVIIVAGPLFIIKPNKGDSMTRRIFHLAILFAFAISSWGGIKIAALQIPDSSRAESLVDAAAEVADFFPELDIILGPAEALGGDSNRARIGFDYSSPSITPISVDTLASSADVLFALHRLRQIADSANITIIPGSLWEVDENYRCFESVPIIGPDGEIIRVRRKAHHIVSDPLVDSTVRRDFITTGDGDFLSYLITISNETRDIPAIYGGVSSSADLVLLCSRFWGDSLALAQEHIRTESPPNWDIVSSIFPPDYVSGLVGGNWTSMNAPLVASILGQTPAAGWTGTLMRSGTHPDEWYAFREILRTGNALILDLEPDSPQMRFNKRLKISAMDAAGDPMDSLEVYYMSAGMDSLKYVFTDMGGMAEVPLCGPDSFLVLFRKGHLHLMPKDTFMAVVNSSPDTIYVREIPDSLWDVPETDKPEDFEISVHPNPFNSALSIQLRGVGAGIRPPAQVGVSIFDLSGRLVADLRPPSADAEGPTPLIWEPGEGLPSGVYLIRANRGSEVRRLRALYIK